MYAIVAPQPGDPSVLEVVERPQPEPAPGELLVRIAATSVNRADLLQRAGRYTPPPGSTDILGLECSGEVAAVGSGVTGWDVGNPVCAVLPGGGYAQYTTVPAAVAMPLPPGLSSLDAGAVPEVFTTAFDNVFVRAGLRAGETLLVHGGASGVGTAAIQLAVRAGCRVLVTAGSADRIDACTQLGADGGAVYRDDNWVDQIKDLTGGRGVDVILDVVGAAYLDANLNCLALEGRLVVIGMQGGTKGELNLGMVLPKRLSVMGSTLRARTTEEKAPLMARMVADVWPGFGDGSLRPVIDRVLPLRQAAEGHAALEGGGVVGKIVLSAD